MASIGTGAGVERQPLGWVEGFGRRAQREAACGKWSAALAAVLPTPHRRDAAAGLEPF